MEVQSEQALALLRLLHLADSALPIGTAAHSFGLETLVARRWLEVEGLEAFLRAYLWEAGGLECAFCLSAQRLGVGLGEEGALPDDLACWQRLNSHLSAFKMARESREASAALGRRLLQLAQGLRLHPLVPVFIQAAKAGEYATHQSAAFGLIGGLLTIDETSVGVAYLQQALTGLVSACQRLLPLGQSQASQILWRLHPAIIATVERSVVAVASDDMTSFCALLDLGSMVHPALSTRLFIS